MPVLTIHRAGPGVTVQDAGRPGYLAQGLSRGGAADMLALAEGAALLGQPATLAALELAGGALTLWADAPARIALTGAPMRASLDGMPLTWHASHALPVGARLDLQPGQGGYSYLHLGGGVCAPNRLGACSAHLAAGLGAMLQAGDRLQTGADPGGRTGLVLDPLARFGGGTLRMVATPQTPLFPPDMLARFTATRFTRDARANRMGQRLSALDADPGLTLDAGLHILSQPIVPGDIQITGDGAPFVLLAEAQTTGGYPRIGTVLPCDLPRLVQAPHGAALRFRFLPLTDARALERAEATRRAALPKTLRPLIRDPHDIADLLSYHLISGATRGDELEEEGKETP